MITLARWKLYKKVQKSGKRNMFGFDMEIQKRWDEAKKHFEEDHKTEDLQ